MSKQIKKGCFFVFFIIINMILSFVIEPARSASGFMWESYYEQEELDMIFVGSSLCQGTFEPYIFDEYMGINSMNMGTPLQAVPQTVRALEKALQDHDIKTVIFGMGFSTLKAEAVLEAELTFEKSRIQKKGEADGLLKGLTEGMKYLWSDEVKEDEKSIAFFFPWIYNRGELSKDNIIENIRLKIRQIQEKYFGIPIEDNQIFHKGYQNHGGVVFNYDNVWETNTYRYYDAELNEAMMEAMEDLIQLCNSYQVELIVVNTPHPFFDVVSCYEFYEQNQNDVKALCDKYEVDYYDFSLAKPEIFDAKASYYSDYEHLNLEGSQEFSRQLAEFLLRRENGENMDVYFYSISEFLEIYADWLEEWQNY